MLTLIMMSDVCQLKNANSRSALKFKGVADLESGRGRGFDRRQKEVTSIFMVLRSNQRPPVGSRDGSANPDWWEV